VVAPNGLTLAPELPLEAGIPVLPARGGEGVVRRLFEPTRPIQVRE
jgi:hypothetical protein